MESSPFELLKQAIKKSSKQVTKAAKKVRKKPKLNDTKTWPRPPAKGKVKEGPPSRTKPKKRGEKSLYMMKKVENGDIVQKINITTHIGTINLQEKGNSGKIYL